MKCWIICLLIAGLLCGCGAEETLETVSDEWIVPAMAQPREISVRLPDNAIAPVLEQGSRQIYMAEDYEIMLETVSAGDLDATLRDLSGYGKEQMTVLETQQNGVSRYDFVWTTVGEKGERLGRGVVLDDGNYHYCLTALKDAEKTGKSQVVWRDVFSSFSLVF